MGFKLVHPGYLIPQHCGPTHNFTIEEELLLLSVKQQPFQSPGLIT